MSETESLQNIKNQYLNDFNKVGIYHKSKRYSKFGFWGSIVAWYVVVILYSSRSTIEQSHLYLAITVSAVLSVLTVLLMINAKRASVDSRTVASHDIASFIHAYEERGAEGLVDRYNQIERRFKENELLSKKRKEEVSELIDEIESSDDGCDTKVIESNLNILAEDATQAIEIDFESPRNESDSNTHVGEPGLIEVILSSVSADNINSGYMFWLAFFAVAAIGTAIALFQGHAWGIFSVTILFAGLRFYDNRST